MKPFPTLLGSAILSRLAVTAGRGQVPSAGTPIESQGFNEGNGKLITAKTAWPGSDEPLTGSQTTGAWVIEKPQRPLSDIAPVFRLTTQR